MRRPNRSDEHLPPEEEAEIEEETREYFEAKVAKRHPKPQRSDYCSPDDQNVDAAIRDPSSYSIPELDKLHLLIETRTEKLAYDSGRSAVVDEYVETDYYKDLNRMDKQHHTTGTGFIKVEMEVETETEKKVIGVENVAISFPELPNRSGSRQTRNPATSEWIPSPSDDDHVAGIPSSCKPNRSEPPPPPPPHV